MVLVWRLDRWGRTVADLLANFAGTGSPRRRLRLTDGGVGSDDAGWPRNGAGLVAVFAEFERDILRERVRAGLAHARQNGKKLGRPITAGLHIAQVRTLHRAGISKAEIARQLHSRPRLRSLSSPIRSSLGSRRQSKRGTRMAQTPTDSG